MLITRSIYAKPRVRCSSAVVYDIYMVGRETSTAVPHIMFSCKQPKSRKQAVAAVRRSAILQRFPGIELGRWEYPPHILNLRLLASSGLEEFDLDDSASHYFIRPIPDPENPTETLAIQFVVSGSTHHRVATIGSVTEQNGKLFYVLPQHIFSAPYTTEIDSELEDSSGCEFGAFAGDDQISDEEAEFTSQYSMSPRASEAGSDSDYDSEDIFWDSEAQNWSGESQSITRNDDEYEERRLIPLPLPKGDALKRLARAPDVSSPDLDYALLEVDPNDRLLTGLPVLSKSNVSKVGPGGAAVTTVTGAGHLIHGRLSGRVSYVRAPNSEKFQEALVVDVNGPLNPGDCGSIVRDDITGKIYGHIFLGSVESGVAYIMPAANVLRNIKAAFKRIDDSAISSNIYTSNLSTESEVTSMTAAPIHSRHEYKARLICALDATELAVTAMLDNAHPTLTCRVDNASVAPSACHENCVFAFKPTGQAGKWSLQRTDTNQDMEDVPYRDEAAGELKGLCCEMEAVHHINELACAVTSYLSDLHNHRGEHQYAEMAVARRIEMLPDVRKIVPVRVAKRGDRVKFADISAATQASYVLDMDSPDTEKANNIFVGSSPDEGSTGQEENPMVGSCTHESSDTQEYCTGSSVFFVIWESTPRFRKSLTYASHPLYTGC